MRGIHLISATQKTLHEGVRTFRKVPERRDTTVRLDMTRHSVEELNGNGIFPADSEIWLSIRSKDLSKGVRGFLWKNIHNAYRIGEKWATIPNFEHRAICSLCGIEESMEHILLDCVPSLAIPTVWGLAKTLWLRSHRPWPLIRLGTILGCALPDFTRPPAAGETDPKPLVGKNRLFTILVSESAHLIWKIRCERLIQREDDPERRHSEREIVNKWMLAMNNRLKTDVIQTNATKYKGNALSDAIVLKTWSGVLQDHENLPENWIRQAGGLVGIEVRRPEGH
ncbi:hypothetical protein HYPSUDRAFT_180488 [Hypholoma sublateritium FD-334 SS-4]|uniref:Reverse transcriptase zinc-binding domain-containing protein n=1 Tax=Hypholoma sublateritium (strain FD-334 SS-4) TaxID=945553 RepID=A0A0D2Q5P6_HYPSF|nr:hypothetical protein HYPSUDRAFT_180488 [Hypholoma sublateritium FD-334 SS-4]